MIVKMITKRRFMIIINVLWIVSLIRGSYLSKKEYKCKKVNIKCNPTDIYRTIDGSCNNLMYPEWGMSYTPQSRFLPPSYDNDIDSPREMNLPSPRLISNTLFASKTKKKDYENTAQLMAWGRLLSHEIIFTPRMNVSVNCCASENLKSPDCYTIHIPDDDPHFTSDCMNFRRSSQTTLRCMPDGRREQLNEATSIIDGSMVYGSSEERMSKLRLFTKGKMKTSKFNLLPENPEGDCIREDFTEDDYCQLAGDPRADYIPSLGVNLLMFLREHNTIAEQLSEINRHWDDEKIFQETRKIIAAMIQHITFSEYLPIILGHDHMTRYNLHVTDTGFQDLYDSKINPTIHNAFAVASFRFGHSQIVPIMAYLYDDYKTMESFPLDEQLMRTYMVLRNEGKNTDDLMRWLTIDNSMTSDRFFEKEVRNLFMGTDLPARDIQRGRDHGLPSYTNFRDFCGLSVPRTFRSNKNDWLIDHNDLDKEFQLLYKNVDAIDLFVGGMTERPVHGGLVGPTFACLISKQFEAMKKGDRFWYERPEPQTGFTLEQLNAIKGITLSKVICENLNLSHIQTNAFKVVSKTNRLIPCSSQKGLNLNLWMDN